MPQKNIYVKESDLELIEWAEKNESGESLSSLFAECLRTRKQKADKEAALRSQGFKTIEVDITDQDGNIRSKRFDGRWIVTEFRTENESYRGLFDAAFTKGGRIVALYSENEEYERFEVFETFDDLKNDPQLPEDYVSAVAAELGENYVEILDI